MPRGTSKLPVVFRFVLCVRARASSSWGAIALDPWTPSWHSKGVRTSLSLLHCVGFPHRLASTPQLVGVLVHFLCLWACSRKYRGSAFKKFWHEVMLPHARPARTWRAHRSQTTCCSSAVVQLRVFLTIEMLLRLSASTGEKAIVRQSSTKRPKPEPKPERNPNKTRTRN